jgi:hypothetical protein
LLLSKLPKGQGELEASIQAKTTVIAGDYQVDVIAQWPDIWAGPVNLQ